MTNPSEHNLESSREGNEQIELIPVLNIHGVPQKERCFTNLRKLENIFILVRNLDFCVSGKSLIPCECVFLVQQAGLPGLAFSLDMVDTATRAQNTFRAPQKCFIFYFI